LFILAYFLSSSSYFPFSLLSITYFSFPSTPITYIYSLSLHDALPIWRFVFLELIRKWARPIHHSISHEREELNIYYTTTIEVSEDRKSTRLNYSHVSISYAVFCLKKKNIRTSIIINKIIKDIINIT